MTARAAVEPALDLSRLCEALRRVDPDILEIVLFGSAVYAPDLARDIDLVVTTRSKKDNELYWAAVADYGKNVDVLVREPGQPMGRDIALSVFAIGRSLYGDGATAQEAQQHTAVPTYEDARRTLRIAEKLWELARTAEDPPDRDPYYRAAFDSLFDTARHAAITFLSTDDSRWGQLPRRLPAPFSERFRQFIGTLHVQFKYDGNYPKDKPDEVFTEWRDKVSRFIDDLEEAAAARAETGQPENDGEKR